MSTLFDFLKLSCKNNDYETIVQYLGFLQDNDNIQKKNVKQLAALAWEYKNFVLYQKILDFLPENDRNITFLEFFNFPSCPKFCLHLFEGVKWNDELANLLEHAIVYFPQFLNFLAVETNNNNINYNDWYKTWNYILDLAKNSQASRSRLNVLNLKSLFRFIFENALKVQNIPSCKIWLKLGVHASFSELLQVDVDLACEMFSKTTHESEYALKIEVFNNLAHPNIIEFYNRFPETMKLSIFGKIIQRKHHQRVQKCLEILDSTLFFLRLPLYDFNILGIVKSYLPIDPCLFDHSL